MTHNKNIFMTNCSVCVIEVLLQTSTLENLNDIEHEFLQKKSTICNTS